MTSEGSTSPPGGDHIGEHYVVFAAPRSGTTWLKAMLNLHPDIHCTELRFFGKGEMLSYDHPARPDVPNVRLTLDQYTAKMARHMTPFGAGMTAPQTERALTRVMLRAVTGLVGRRAGKRVLVDKVTPYQGTERETFEIYREWFPDARFVFLVRDGRDVAVSGMYHWYKRRLQSNQSSFEAARQNLIDGDPSAKSLPSAFRPGELEAWAESWAEIARLERDHTGLTLRYEDLLDDAAGEMSRLLAILGAGADKRVVSQCVAGATFEIMSGGRRRGQSEPGAHVRSGIVGDWRHVMTRTDGRAFQSIAGDQLARLGYAGASDWTSMLGDRFAATPPR